MNGFGNRATIIIPVYNQAEWIADAINSALAQTVPCQILVIDDTSTDDSLAIARRLERDARERGTPHDLFVASPFDRRLGPGAIRNYGIERAMGQYLMFLDADDVIHPAKVETQIAAFAPGIDWTFCDVRIEDEVTGQTINASDKYGYRAMTLDGSIAPLLRDRNILPVMAPLLRNSRFGAIRFPEEEQPREDWPFWQAIAAEGQVRYVPQVLATYRHRRYTRSRLAPEHFFAPRPTPAVVAVTDPHPPATPPVRDPAVGQAPTTSDRVLLNLGCGTQGTPAWHPLDGLINLDKSLGWRFEDGLGAFADRSVHGITISHALMYVAIADWPVVFQEFARVLAPGGVIRITEDETADPRSSRRGGWRGSAPAVTLTSAALIRTHLEAFGFRVCEVSADTTHYADRSLCQAWHGQAPDVCFVEGVRHAAVLFAPHNDDETLFAAFTIQRYRPAVVVCFASERDYGAADVREAETRAAVAVLGGGAVEQWHGGDLVARMRVYDARHRPTQVWAPALKGSHREHWRVAACALEVFGDRVVPYHTYDGSGAKVRTGTEVEIQPAWIGKKLQALACYTSQFTHPRAHRFFLDDLREYLDVTA